MPPRKRRFEEGDYVQVTVPKVKRQIVRTIQFVGDAGRRVKQSFLKTYARSSPEIREDDTRKKASSGTMAPLTLA